MDATTVDTLAKTISRGSRRRAIHLLTSIPLATILATRVGGSQPAHAANAKGRTHHHVNAKGSDHHHPPQHHDHPDTPCPHCTCPPDPRLAAIETCRAKQGVAVAGICECAWLGGEFSDFPCQDGCVCMLTLEGQGFCGEGGPLPERGDPSCFHSAECPALTRGDQVVAQACVLWPTGESPFCWPACQPRPA